MNQTDYIVSNTTQKHASAARSGEQKPLLNNEQHSSNESKLGRPSKKHSSSKLLTREQACARLNCHWQTLIYRQKKGDLTPIRIGRRKYYAAGEVEQLLKKKPVIQKPHYSKRVSVEQPTLWQRIKALFA